MIAFRLPAIDRPIRPPGWRTALARLRIQRTHRERQENQAYPRLHLLRSHSAAFCISVFCTGLLKILSPWPMFIYTILYCVLVQTTGTSPEVSNPLMPSG